MLCADFAAFGQRRNAVGRPESECHDGHGGLTAPGSDQAAAVAQEEIFHVMRAMIGVDHRSLGIQAHAAGAQKMHAKLLLLNRETPFFQGPGGFMNGVGLLVEPTGELEVVVERASW